ncbi:MAG: hypothetical protein LWX83_13600 [Anaerolineae bacterium]|nr:hypothetical protein [Anaerolineae bacterium]
MKIIAYIAAAILIFFGVLFMWAAFSPTGTPAWLWVGLISVLIGFGLIFFASRRKPAETPINITYKVDLPGNVNMEAMKCQSCGGVISAENVTVVNGAPMVNCPYCHTTYQLSEDPKW